MGGVITHITEFPYAISIRHLDDRVRCGGAIISRKHILTAAHCVLALKDYSQVKIVAGTTTLTGPSQSVFMIQSAHPHPLFKPGTKNNHVNRYDIAVILVQGSIAFNEFQNKIDLPSSDIDVGANAIVVGWGKVTRNAKRSSEKLRKVSMRILDNNECSRDHPFIIADEQLCAYRRRHIGLCIGDSGGPLINNGTLVGVASFGRPCGQGVPDIYTRVFSFVDFIRNITSIHV